MNSNLTPLAARSSHNKSDRPPLFVIRTSMTNNSAEPYFYLGKPEVSGFTKNTGYQAENYLAARTKIVRLLDNEYPLPMVILVDLPFVKDEIINFTQWLSRIPELASVPLIYNKHWLNDEQLTEVKNLKIADEVLDIFSTDNSFLEHIRFLQQAKALRSASASEFRQAELPAAKEKRFTAYTITKRAIDILLASAAIILLLPLMLLIALAIRLESRGSVIYRSKRAGKGFRVFQFYKFRTMIPGADKKAAELAGSDMNVYNKSEEGSPVFLKINNDPRVTRVGTFLRNTSLDELPQLLNVLLGDMSLVGNRPLPLYEAAGLTTNEWAERFMAPAGITGLWQIKKRGKQNMSAEERIQLDIDYARKKSIRFDLWIMIKTPAALFQSANV